MDARIDSLTEALKHWHQTQAINTKAWVVAYSGGVDSHCLLHACARYLKQHHLAIALKALHVNHGIHPESAQWARHCQQVCHDLGLSCEVAAVTTRPESGTSLEAWARDQRYQLLADTLHPHEILLTAQTQDDQVETLLMNVMRGSGIKGLACMPVVKAFGSSELHRPWLSCTRKAIEVYANQHHLKWVEDPSNQNQQLLRNFIRKDLLPRMQDKIPGVNQAIARSAHHCQEALRVLEDMAELDAQSGVDEQQRIEVERLQLLPVHRQKNLIRHWITTQQHPLPPEPRLLTLLEQSEASKDRQPSIQWQQSRIQRFKKHWYLLPAHEPKAFATQWQGEEVMTLPSGQRIKVVKKLGAGVKIPANTQVFIRSPQGSVRARPHNRRVSKPLKKWWQEYEVPTWQRLTWPLIYINQELAMIPGLFVCEGWQVDSFEWGHSFEFIN